MPPATLAEPAACSTVQALSAMLRQLVELLEAMTDEQYRRKPVGVVASNVGGHVRHCVDHVEALLAALEAGELCYDRRRRGTDVESCRTAALKAIDSLEQRLLETDLCEHATLRMSVLVRPESPSIEVATTVGRELVFVLSHTMHHNALVAVMAQTLGVSVPPRFGYAPSTPSPREAEACAR